MPSTAVPTPPAAPPLSDASTEPARATGFGTTDLLLLLMAALWGGNFFAIQYGAAHIAPLAFNASRMILGGVILAAITLATVKVPWPSRADTLRMLGCGVIGNGLYQVFFIAGVSRARGGTASLILAASPAALAIIGWMTHTEKLTRILALGVVMSIGGVVMVILGAQLESTGAGSWQGSAFLVAAMLTWAVYVTLLRPLSQRINGLHLTLITLIGGLVPLVLFALPSLRATDFTTLMPRTWLAMFYSGFGAIVLAYIIYYHGLRTLGPTRTSMYANLQPFVALIVAQQFQGDAITPWQFLGLVLITGGLLLARKKA
jgi:drug/metabolite transporter (DMT)-like permease